MLPPAERARGSLSPVLVHFHDLGQIRGRKVSLRAALRAASKALDRGDDQDAVKHLERFRDTVDRAQKNGQIGSRDADMLREEADNIIDKIHGAP